MSHSGNRASAPARCVYMERGEDRLVCSTKIANCSQVPLRAGRKCSTQCWKSVWFIAAFVLWVRVLRRGLRFSDCGGGNELFLETRELRGTWWALVIGLQEFLPVHPPHSLPFSVRPRTVGNKMLSHPPSPKVFRCYFFTRHHVTVESDPLRVTQSIPICALCPVIRLWVF